MPTSATTSPGVHYTTIERKIPTWLKQAPPETHHALRNWRQAPTWLATAIQRSPEIAKAWQEEHARHREHQAQVQKLFEQLPDLQAYAARTLTEAIKQRFGLDLDVHNTYLVDARLIDTDASDACLAVNRATRSLLHSALHNFDPHAATERGMDAPKALLKRSVILDHRRFMGTVPITNAVDISAEDFAGLCRTLDIGGKYHQWLHAIYYPEAADESALAVYETLGRAEVSTFRQTLHFARLKGDISEAFYTAALAAPLDRTQTTSSPVTFSLLTLWEVELTGVVLITLQTDGHQAVALYIPEDNAEPLKEFTTREALQVALRDRLQANIDYLDKHIADRDKGPIRARLQDRLMPLDWSVRGIHERVPDPHATLHPVAQPFNYSFQSVLAFQKAQRHEQDALFHAIPTEIVDRRTAQAHRELIAGRMLTALNIAGFFVPGLGEAMLAVCVAQLAYEVYEGIEAWKNDELDTAHEYLVDVIENVALMAALSAAAKAVRGAKGKKGDSAMKEASDEEEPELDRIPVETPSFIEELEDVEMPDGQIRLWKPDLAPFVHAIRLPEGLEVDEAGLRHHQDRRWLMLQDKAYSIRQVAAGHRLEHPLRRSAYEPLVRHNGAGAWLLPLEQPGDWQELTLARRMGHLNAHFSDETLLRILRVSGTHEAVLRSVLRENQRLPALLEDTLARFKLDQTLKTLSTNGRPGGMFDKAYAELPVSQAPAAGLIRDVYPGLPNAVTEEILRNASSDELDALNEGKVPLRLAEEIRIFQRQVRLARAYEGLYLSSGRSWDTDCLILHTLERLNRWPGGTRIQLRQRTGPLARNTSIGPQDALHQTTIIRAEAGYIVEDPLGPEKQHTAHSSIYGALHEALPEVLTKLDVRGASDLERLLQSTPLLPRDELRKALGMQAVRPGYRSPMRLADGRLGYPLSGGQASGGAVQRRTLLDAISEAGLVSATRSAEQILTVLESTGLSYPQLQLRVNELIEQHQELQSALDDWHEGITSASDLEAHDHQALRRAVLQHWRDTAVHESGEHQASLHLERIALADIPMNLPPFFTSRVRRLRLTDLAPGRLVGWMQHERLLVRLLQQLSQLESLEINRAYVPTATPSTFHFSLPVIAEHLPNLRALRFSNQNVGLTGNDIDSIGRLAQLRHLELRGNRFSNSHMPNFSGLELDYLGLDQMQLRQWPRGLDANTLRGITRVSLRDNLLRTLPSFLLDGAANAPGLANVALGGNAITESQVLRVMLHENDLSPRIHIDRPLSPTFSARLTRLRRERASLREAIEGWISAAGSQAPLTDSFMADQRRIEAAINQFWHSQEIGVHHLHLRLEDVALEHFPTQLPAIFNNRVEALALSRLSGSVSQMDEFLRRFPNVTRLTITNHTSPLQSLPTALVQLRFLEHLELPDLGLNVDQSMIDTFARMPSLRTLELSGNRLGSITQVPEDMAMRLTYLGLTNMALQQWPDWLDTLLAHRLEQVNLDSNQISSLPDRILETADGRLYITSISLFNNPLTADTITRLRTYSQSQIRYSFAISLPGDLQRLESSDEDLPLLDHVHLAPPVLSTDAPVLEDWMLGNALQNEALETCWQALRTLEHANNLLPLVGRLRHSAPYISSATQTLFCERVRQVLVAATANASERSVLNALAAEGLPDPQTGVQTCYDGALLAFNNMEIYLQSQRLLQNSGDSQQSVYRALLRLFRAQELDRLAAARTASGDIAEVRLAYRHGLASELDLPVADSLRYYSHAQLQPSELSSVLEQVRQAERGESFLRFMISNSEWRRYLRHFHATRFEEIEQHYLDEMRGVNERGTTLQADVAAMTALAESKQEQEDELIRELTLEARPDQD